MKNISDLKKIYFLTLLLLLFTYFLYSFGVNSGFFLDDIGNLQALSRITKFDINQISLFSLSGFAGQTGRPLSLLTFALQFNHWPNNPAAFKLANIFIHLLNTLLVFILSKKLFFLQSESRKKHLELALIVTAIWACHPLQVTTVLYSIQRMTELSATFVLFGIISYLHGRSLLSKHGQTNLAYLWMTIGLLFCTLLSMLCKENGILIFLYILSIEKTILNTFQPTHHFFKYWQRIFILTPIIIVTGYLFFTFDAVSYYAGRNFSLSERLITENAVVLDYLRKIITPSFNSFSLYYDDFPITKKITDSYQAFFGFIFILSSIIFSIIYRKRFPVICFGFLWYYSGHLLESTYLPLEIYFEHRNYLPLFGIVITIVSLVYKVFNYKKTKSFSISLIVCSFSYFAYLTFNTYTQTNLWGTPHKAKLAWAIEKPSSTRAQSAAANVMAFKGNYIEALNFTQKIIQLTPNDPSPYIAWLHYRCFTKEIPPPDIDHLHQLAKHGTVTLSSIFILNSIVLDLQKGSCKNVSYDEISIVFKNLEQNKKLIKKADFFQIYSMLEGNQGHYIKAMNLANQSLSYKPNANVALFQLRWLALLGDYPAAYKYMKRVKEINNSNPKTSLFLNPSIKEWEDFLSKKVSQ